jgi:hypothetical protein
MQRAQRWCDCMALPRRIIAHRREYHFEQHILSHFGQKNNNNNKAQRSAATPAHTHANISPCVALLSRRYATRAKRCCHIASRHAAQQRQAMKEWTREWRRVLLFKLGMQRMCSVGGNACTVTYCCHNMNICQHPAMSDDHAGVHQAPSIAAMLEYRIGTRSNSNSKR